MTARDPGDVARSVFAALEAGRWSEVAASFHPDAVDRFRADMIEMASDAMGRGGAFPFVDVLGVDSLAELEAFPPRDLLERYIARQTAPFLDDRGGEDGPFLAIDVLGSVEETPSRAHVVYRKRWRYGGRGAERVAVEDLRLHEGRWMIFGLQAFHNFFLHG